VPRDRPLADRRGRHRERHYLDLVEPAMIALGSDGHGEIVFGALQAGLDLAYGQSDVAFTFIGADHGDDAILRAEREGSSATC
jgi:hypothetical protein